MTLPYKARLITEIAGTTFELVRWRRKHSVKDIKAFTRGLVWPWRLEKTVDNKHTITPRWEPLVSAESTRNRAKSASLVAHRK